MEPTQTKAVDNASYKIIQYERRFMPVVGVIFEGDIDKLAATLEPFKEAVGLLDIQESVREEGVVVIYTKHFEAFLRVGEVVYIENNVLYTAPQGFMHKYFRELNPSE